ncbi:3D domain-containing protein [Deinococcus radiopugnans]|uniref:3D (Asp-Asp-Asp) domain-containing protein n=1 Tax=Deinococcus radiopugnans ATCC 19172 TaxID=585398 RepID=A0ABR6NSE7_9DEIO|nr:3D domain-containing protein [Deinococcus radiopugnans]MBB6016968.1 3D (Asp-Asp-Asp) domain-containing protein [Deinococcus radiopugnans ATCC 19172]
MVSKLNRWTFGVLFGIAGLACATPALPASSVASDAVRQAMVVTPPPAPVVQRAAAPAARPQPTAQAQAAQARAAAVAQAQRPQAQPAPAAPVAALTARGRSAIVRATAYNSLAGQTDSTPFITATGTRTRPGVVALSRDMLRLFPYGTRITIEDLSGRYNNLLRGRTFIVEDTMAARKTGSLDIWMSTRSQAINFGARQVRITALR